MFWTTYLFVSHGRTRQSGSFNLRTLLCKTPTFQASYFNRIVKLWNYVCKLAPPTSFCSPNAFQLFSRKLMSTHISRVYDLNYHCTWTLVQACFNCVILDSYLFLVMEFCVCFCFNFRSFSRGGASHWSSICSTAPFGSCLFSLCYLFIYLEYPIKLIKEKEYGYKLSLK